MIREKFACEIYYFLSNDSNVFTISLLNFMRGEWWNVSISFASCSSLF
mgnify:FL=1